MISKRVAVMLYLAITGAFRSSTNRQRTFLVQAFSSTLIRRATRTQSTTTTTTTSHQSGKHNQQQSPAWNLRAKKADDPSALHRAERVLANRTGKPRATCRSMLKQRRVWEKVEPSTLRHDEHAHELSLTLPILPHHEETELTPDFRVSPKLEEEQVQEQDEEAVEEDLNFMATEMEVQGHFRPVIGPSKQIRMDAELLLDKRFYIPLPLPLLVAYHKPKWVLSVRNDKHERPCLTRSLLPGFHPVGRLDYDSSGLLLFSTNGKLTQRLLHPKHSVPKIYKATCVGNVDSKALKKQLAAGVETSEGTHTAELLDVVHYEEESVKPYLEEVRRNLPREYNLEDLSSKGHLDVFDATELTVVRLAVQEGKYRMVRRILANSGFPVVDLERLSIGDISLGDLKPGEWRQLDSVELKWARSQLPPKKTSKNVQKLKKRRIPDESQTEANDEEEKEATEHEPATPKALSFFRAKDENLLREKTAKAQ